MPECCQRIEHMDLKDIMVIWGEHSDEFFHLLMKELKLREWGGLLVSLREGDMLANLDEGEMLKAGWIRVDKELK